MTDTTFSADQWTRLLEALGLPADADAETAVMAVEDLVTTPDTAKVAAGAGLTQLDPATLAQLRADAEQGRTLAAAARKRHISEVVMAGISKGKIPPARRVHWEQLIAADPTYEQVLASMPADILPLTEIGHAQPGDDITETADWFR